jgi:hypothetical protein
MIKNIDDFFRFNNNLIQFVQLLLAFFWVVMGKFVPQNSCFSKPACGHNNPQFFHEIRLIAEGRIERKGLRKTPFAANQSHSCSSVTPPPSLYASALTERH